VAQASQISDSSIATPIGRRLYSDGWDGYPRARDRLLDAVAAAGGGGNALVLGGDVHRHVAAQLRQRSDDPRSPVVAAEFVCSSISTRGLAEPWMAAIRASNPDLLHARSDERGYAWIEITPQEAQCDFRATAHPVQPGAALHSQARFVVEAGRPGVARD
jgi:alkaline phosphatase D